MRPAGGPVFACVHRGALGDFALTWPALSRLRERYPRHRFVGVGRPAHLELAVALGLLDAGLYAESSALLSFFNGEALPPALAALDAALVWMREDPALDALLRTLPGPAAMHPPFPGEGTHALEHHLAALAKFGGAVPAYANETFALNASTPPQAFPAAGAILLHPGSGSPAKNFERSFYAGLASDLSKDSGLKVKIVLGPAEEGDSGFYRERFEVLTPASPLALAHLLAVAALFVGNDSGPAHVAALLGTPTVALFRDTKPEAWCPRGPAAVACSTASEEEARNKVDEALKTFRFGTKQG
jgi:ADP-heptose:LPS heptosyltransferase